MDNTFYIIVDTETKKYLKKTARADTYFSFSNEYQKAQTPDERRAVVMKSWNKCWTDKIGQARIFSSRRIAMGGYNLQQFYTWVEVEKRVIVKQYVAIPQYDGRIPL